MEPFNYIKEEGSKIISQKSMKDFAHTSLILEPGVYKALNTSMMGFCAGFQPIEQKEDLVTFSDGVVADILKKTGEFFSDKTKDIYKDLKINHKMGMILHGPHGTGKTCTARLVMQQLVNDYGAICLDMTNSKLSFIKKIIEVVRTFQDNPVVVFIDEIDYNLNNEENEYLSFLDGNESIDNCIVLGTTNNLEDIPTRIKHRKSRIKYLFEVKSFPYAVYREYILDRLPNIDKPSLDKFSYLAVENSLTLDSLKHAIIDFRMDGTSIEESISNSAELAKEESKERDNY